MKRIIIPIIAICTIGCSEDKDLTTKLNYDIKDSTDQKGQIGNQTEIYLKVVIPNEYDKKQIDTISSIIRHRNLLVPRIDIDFFTETYYDVKPCYARAFYPDDEQVKKNTKEQDLFNEPRELFINGNPKGMVK